MSFPFAMLPNTVIDKQDNGPQRYSGIDFQKLRRCIGIYLCMFIYILVYIYICIFIFMLYKHMYVYKIIFYSYSGGLYIFNAI